MKTGKEFWEFLEELEQRKGNKLNVAALGRKVGLVQSTISNQKNRNQLPKSEDLYHISKYYGVSMEYLLTGEDKEGINPSLNYLVEYLNNADKETIRMVERILQVKKQNSTSMTEVS